MATQTDSTIEGQIQFIENHQTALDAGEYKIEITQTVSINNSPTDQFTDTFTSNLTFVVQGSRFELNPQDIHSLFPPTGSSGNHSYVLPHIVLKRSTLPWEREAELGNKGNKYVPWLALLVIYEEEEKLLKTIDKNQLDVLWKNLSDGNEIKNKTQQLWDSLVRINWIKSINNDNEKAIEEAIIVKKKDRKAEKIDGDFSKLEQQIEAIFAQIKTTKVIPLRNLKHNYTDIVKWKAIKLEIGQHEDDQVSVIDVRKDFLSQILPTTQDLKYLAHVRQVNEFDVKVESLENIDKLPQEGKNIVFVGKDKIKDSYYVCIFDSNGTMIINNNDFKPKKSKTEIDNNLDNDSIDADTKAQLIQQLSLDLDYKLYNEPLAVVISNRLPKKNGRSTAYLVSLEGKFNNSNFNYETENDSDYIRLVTLKSWSFSCSETKQNFQGLLKNLNQDTLILPILNHQEANQYIVKGYVPLPHYLRQGGKTYSWYHSPLLPGKNPTNITLSKLGICCADQLIAYDSKKGLFDISYAAAWQLGQLLALQDKKFAVSLFNWKRTHAQQLAKDNQQALYPHLFLNFSNNNSDKNSELQELSEDIKNWFERLGLLSHVPFYYLVPDEKMLPIESIRFFWLDWFWVASLLDGAFSIGRVQESERQSNPITGEPKIITGFLMRSEVVSGWPDLQVDGSQDRIEGEKVMENKLKVLRCDRLSEDVLICLFDGDVQTVDISLKPEGLHFGFNYHKNGNLWRELRKLNGEKESDWQVTINEIKAFINQEQKVIQITNLADKIKEKLKDQQIDINTFTSAQFALQMVQGAEKVRFLRY